MWMYSSNQNKNVKAQAFLSHHTSGRRKLEGEKWPAVSLFYHSLSQTDPSIIYLAFGHKEQEEWHSLNVKKKGQHICEGIRSHPQCHTCKFVPLRSQDSSPAVNLAEPYVKSIFDGTASDWEWWKHCGCYLMGFFFSFSRYKILWLKGQIHWVGLVFMNSALEGCR